MALDSAGASDTATWCQHRATRKEMAKSPSHLYPATFAHPQDESSPTTTTPFPMRPGKAKQKSITRCVCYHEGKAWVKTGRGTSSNMEENDNT